MTDANDPITPHLTYNSTSGHANGFIEGLTKREYFATHSGITWRDAAINCESNLGRTPTIDEVAVYFSKMKAIAADALITALNQTK